ncbi:helix-turn-helix domain-containing protein [Treponema zuelzerae]|uniref:Helix-turn-helix domain-containing protein n=1 Tax=Teretinema zuelzerae TaxID=156 RepID=A0AAE3JHY9_9SPIR|nr:helix-turn-helix transcriptional regulator [Teretinema zuelzerae]MCD1653546.1 helix-turn-helix domain-containing protein [Teretinema zuelzerae]
MNFNERLRAEIEYSGLLHKEIADKAGIKKRAFDMYVGSRLSMPPADIAVKIAEVLGVSVEYLVTGNKAPKEVTLPPETNKVIALLSSLDSKEKEAFITLLEALANKR